MTKAAFAAFVRGREERYELVAGHPIMMVRVSRNHSIVCRNLLLALAAAVDLARFHVSPADFGVETGEDMRFPDVLVEPAGGAGGDYAAVDPVFIAEVMSPSSVRIDLFDRRDAYAALPSVADYLVLSQDEPVVWQFARMANGRFPEKPAEIKGRDEGVVLAGLPVTLRLADLYRGIGGAP